MKLTRYLRSGRVVETPGLSPHDARELSGRMLFDNAVASKKESQLWAASLTVGVRSDHPSGYGCLIEEDS